MNNQTVQDTVLAFLTSRNDIPGLTEEDRLACEYLDKGVIDSVGMVEMVVFLEQRFDVHFGAGDMQSSEFRTIGGLIGLVERLIKDKERSSRACP